MIKISVYSRDFDIFADADALQFPVPISLLLVIHIAVVAVADMVGGSADCIN